MTKNKSPAFQFYPKDWLSNEKVAAMTNKERGEYINLLCYDWINDGLSEALFKGASTTVKDCFQPNGKKWFNPRLLFERKKQKEWRAKSSEGGKKSAKARWEKGKVGGKGGYKMVVTKPQPNGNSSSSSSSSNKKKYTKKKFIPPTIEQIKEYAKESGYDIDAAHVFKYYNTAGWKDSEGKPVLNWKQKIRGVWFRPENKKIDPKKIVTIEEMDAYLKKAGDLEHERAEFGNVNLYLKSKYSRL